MAFDPKTLPSEVYAAYKVGPLNWMVVVKTAVQKGITDLDRLASIVFYLHHPERNGRPIDAGETDMINQWKGFRTMIKPMVPVMSKPDPVDPKPPAIHWELTDIEAWKMRDLGDEVVEWAKIAPVEDVETREFDAPAHLSGNYKVIFAWKSANPTIKCVADSKPTRVKALVLLRDDYNYWYRIFGDHRATVTRREMAALAIRDYRDLIINKKKCPRAAYNYLKCVDQDVGLTLILGLFQLIPTYGLPGVGALSNGIPNSLDFIKKIMNNEFNEFELSRAISRCS